MAARNEVYEHSIIFGSSMKHETLQCISMKKIYQAINVPSMYQAYTIFYGSLNVLQVHPWYIFWKNYWEYPGRHR